MNFHTYFAKAKRPVETCVVGTGAFGQSFLTSALRVPLMSARIAVDRDAEIAAKALRAAGIEPGRIRVCATPAEAASAWAAGDFIAADTLATVIDLPFDVLIEATGHPESGARHAAMAVAADKHLALVSKEVDSVVGPGLARAAAERGRVVTPVDGDQPSLLMNLVSWAEVLGFEVISAGKSSEYDFVFDPTTGVVTSNGKSGPAPDLARHWILGDRDLAQIIADRSEALSAFPQRAVPDLCELGLVANAVDLGPDVRDFHVPVLRVSEVPTVFSDVADGGILSGGRRIDAFHCLRAPDEASFAGGVFVVVRCTDAASWAMLAEKGHIVSRSGATAMCYLPRHLLGLEAATSVLDAAIHGVSGYGDDYRPRLDLVAMATEDLAPGTVLTVGGHHHTIDGLTAVFSPGAPLGPKSPVPFYLAADRKLVRPLQRGQMIVLDDLDIDADSQLLALRRQQDAMFFPESALARAS